MFILGIYYIWSKKLLFIAKIKWRFEQKNVFIFLASFSYSLLKTF